MFGQRPPRQFSAVDVTSGQISEPSADAGDFADVPGLRPRRPLLDPPQLAAQLAAQLIGEFRGAFQPVRHR